MALFTPDGELDAALRDWPPVSVHPVGLGWQGLFHRLAEWQQGGELQRRLAASRLEALLYQVLVQRAAGSLPPPPPAVEAMRDHIQATLDRPVSMAELAAVAGLDPAYASRLFRRHLGVPPVRWATHQRLARAAAWLCGSDEPVHVIAGRVGFDDPYHFSRAFKRWSGRSPGRYRALRLEA